MHFEVYNDVDGVYNLKMVKSIFKPQVFNILSKDENGQKAITPIEAMLLEEALVCHMVLFPFSQILIAQQVGRPSH